jgi:hypothetical protein
MKRHKWLLMGALSAISATLLAVLTVLNPFGQPSAEAVVPPHGPNYPTALGAVNEFTNPTFAFTRQGNCGNTSYCAVVLQGQKGEYVAFGFVVPSAWEIDGIEVSVGGDPRATTDVVQLRLIDGAGALVGDTKSVTLNAGAYREQAAGGATDLWGASWAASTFNDPDFGVRITDDASANGGGFDLNYVSVKVYIRDSDNDGFANGEDNCPSTPNPDQTNTDQALAAGGAAMGLPDGGGNPPPLPGDGFGDACDSDDDNDSYSDTVENYLPTNPLDNCYGGPPPSPTPAAGLPRDAWPPDFNATKALTTADSNFYSELGAGWLADTPVRKRLDLTGDGTVNLSDVLNGFSGKIGWQCR